MDKQASALKRIIAFIIDQIIGLLLLSPIMIIVGDNVFATIFATVGIMALDSVQLYFLKGRTAGKMVFKLRVVDIDSGEPIVIQNIIKRSGLIRIVGNLIGIINPIVPFVYYSVGLAMAYFKNGTKQALWDKFANTIVINEPKIVKEEI